VENPSFSWTSPASVRGSFGGVTSPSSCLSSSPSSSWFTSSPPLLGMCYILCMCVCVGASDTTTASDDPYKLELCRCAGRFLGGSQGGAGMPPPGYAQRSAPGGSPGPSVGVRGNAPKFFFWAVFAIFSGFCYF
jgi:hypothetical protein